MNANIAGFLRAAAERHPAATCIVAGDVLVLLARHRPGGRRVRRRPRPARPARRATGWRCSWATASSSSSTYYGAACGPGWSAVPLNPAYTAPRWPSCWPSSGRACSSSSRAPEAATSRRARRPGGSRGCGSPVRRAGRRPRGAPLAAGQQRRGGDLAGDAGAAAVHLGHQRGAEGGDAHPPARCSPTSSRSRATGTERWPPMTSCSRCCRCPRLLAQRHARDGRAGRRRGCVLGDRFDTDGRAAG